MKNRKLGLLLGLSISLIGCNSGSGSHSSDGEGSSLVSSPVDTSISDLSYCLNELAEAAPISATRAYAFTNVNLVSMVDEKVIPHQTIITKQDQIMWIGDEELAEITDELILIDGTGRYLLPGLSDMHVHRASRDEFPVYVANGITTVRNLFGFTGHLNIRKEANTGVILGPRLYTSGAIIDGAVPRHSGSVSVTSSEKAKQVAQEQHDNGYDFLKVYNGLTTKVYQTITESSRELDMPVVGHVPEHVGLDLVLSAKQRTIEHLDGIGTKLGSNEDWDWTQLNDSDISLFTEYLQEFPETYHVPTLVILEKFAYNKQQLDIFYQGENLKYFCKNFVESSIFMRLAEIIRTSSESEIIKSKNNYSKKVSIVNHMNNNNVKIVAGSDVGNPLLLPAYSLLDELDIFVDAGMSPYQSLQTATVNTAKMLGQFETTGTIEVGKVADMILLPSNPLQNLSTLHNNNGVMIRGQWFNQADLQKRLSNLANHFETAQ